MPRLACSHCGLPVLAPTEGPGGEVFCCYGCYLVSRIVGSQGEEGVRAWVVLRLSIGALLAMNVMMLSVLLYTGSVEPQAAPTFRWVMLGLATPAMAVLGYPFVLGAAGEIARRRLSLDTLIAAGALAAFGVSAANTIRGAGHVYFDTATMLPVLVTLGKLIEATAKTRTGRLVRILETLLPATALRVEADGCATVGLSDRAVPAQGTAGQASRGTGGAYTHLREVALAELRVGDRVRVRPGERIAVDGRIVEGRTTLDVAAFTGESGPRTCGPGDAVLAGTVNGAGGIVVEAERTGEGILLRRIIGLVEEASSSSAAAPSVRMAERVAAAFVPMVLALAVAAGLFWSFRGSVARGGLAALAVMVVACPCAMGIAAPLATALAIGRAARAGVLVRGGDVLERVGQVGTMFFDKTGTVTTNQPAVTAVESLVSGVTEDELLGWLAGLESGSEHAVARGVIAEAKRRGLEIGSVSDLQAFPGQGVRGVVAWRGETRQVAAGTAAFVRPGEHEQEHEHGRGTEVVVAWGGKVRGRVLLADQIREDAAEAIRRLHEAGVATVLLSGDRLVAARAVGERIGIGAVDAPRRPDEKIAALRAARAGGLAPRSSSSGVPVPLFQYGDRRLFPERKRSQSPGVGMVGDGLNDAPALAAADVGIALGAGTDLARSAGHVVLLSDRLVQVPWLVRLSRRTRRIIAQNLAWAFGYNAVALGAAAAGVLHPLLAAIAMVVSSLTLLSNSVRIQSFPDEPR